MTTILRAVPDVVAAERAHRKTVVAATLRLFARLGYEFGFNGHITVRDPGDEDLYWANPLGVPFALTTASDLVQVDASGTVVAGRHPTSLGGFIAQYALHSAQPSAEAVVHVHSPYGFAWSSKPRLLEPVNTDSALLYGLQAVHEDFGRSPHALDASTKVIVQRGHGFVTVGESVEEAAFYFLAAERAAHAQLLIRDPELLATELLGKYTLRPATAREHFAPHLAQILHDHPDVAE